MGPSPKLQGTKSTLSKGEETKRGCDWREAAESQIMLIMGIHSQSHDKGFGLHTEIGSHLMEENMDF